MSLLLGLVKFQQLICVSANIQNWRVRKKSGQFGWILIPVVFTGSLPVCFTESLYNYEERGSLVSSPGCNYQGLPRISTLGDNGIIPGLSQLATVGSQEEASFVLMCIFICSDINNHVSNGPGPIVSDNRRVAGAMRWSFCLMASRGDQIL